MSIGNPGDYKYTNKIQFPRFMKVQVICLQRIINMFSEVHDCVYFIFSQKTL